jgi:two-component system, chemotaxis family, chemotaxis protein CheY
MRVEDGSLADLRVAILDDNRNFQILLRTMLRHLGCRRIEAFSDPGAAMTHVCDTPVDLVFVDFVMPHQTGAEWTHTVRRLADVANPDMAIVLVTGHADHATVGAGLAAGVDDVLAKPLAPETLMRHIRLVQSRPRPYVRAAGYYGPDIGSALRRLRAMGGPAAGRPAARAPLPVVEPRPRPAPVGPSVPGLNVEIRSRDGHSADAMFLD